MSLPKVSINDVSVELFELCPVTCWALDQKRDLFRSQLVVRNCLAIRQAHGGLLSCCWVRLENDRYLDDNTGHFRK
jgi:hypothetical protein